VPTRLLLEGRDLEELLAQVRDEHGADARIVSAEKVRTGGFAGLFSQQKYELTVELGDTPAGEPTPSATIEDLAARADAADATPPSFAAVLAEATPAPTAAEVLERLFADAGPVAGAAADEEQPATPSVRPFRPGANQPVARLGMRPLPAPDPVDSAPQVDPAPPQVDPAPPQVDPAPPQVDPAPPQDKEAPMPVEAVTVDRPRTPDPSEKLAAAYGTAASATTTDLPRRLQSLGVPADLALRATASDMYAAIVEAFAALPVAAVPPDGPGETLVVIGESTYAVDVARTVANSLRLDHDDILFAGHNAAAVGVHPRRRITGAHDARSWAKRLRRSDGPSVVAVEATLDESPWAASIVDAVRPAAVWCVVDASRKTSDVAHQLQGLHRVDAIAVRGTLASGDPASPLSLRIPVALLDGRPATAHAWAAMLCERLNLVAG
jgi:hypothetical protein